ncbi:transposase [Streptomyces pseudogriseolus]
MPAPRKYPLELRERAVRMYRAAEPKPVIRRMAEEIGVHHEALRAWVRQAEAGGPRVDQYWGGRDREPEVSEFSAPGQTLSWDPVRDDRPHLLVEEPQECPVGDPLLFRCVRDPESGTVAAVRKRYGMVFRRALTAPDYYRVRKKG